MPAGRAAARSRIADLGTGSGALLLALLSELPNAFGIGTDISCAALAAARDNAARLGLSPRARVSSTRDFGAALTGAFDLVVSNPPYIATRRYRRLAARGAVRSAARARRRHRRTRLLSRDRRQAPRLLKPGGHLVVELGIGQEPAVAALLRAAGLAPAPRAPRSCWHPARIACGCCHNDAMTHEHCGPAKKHLDYRPETD